MIVYFWIITLFLLWFFSSSTIKEGMDCDVKSETYKNSGTIQNLKESIQEIRNKIDKLTTNVDKNTKDTNKNTTALKKISSELSDQIKNKQNQLNKVSAS